MEQFREERGEWWCCKNFTAWLWDKERVVKLMAEACFEGAQASKSYNSKHVCLPCAHYHDWSYCLPVSCPPGTQDLQVVLYLMSMSIFHRNFLQLSSPKSQLGKEKRGKTFTQMNSWTTAYSFCFSKVKTNCKNDAVVQRSISLFFYCEEKTFFRL